MEGIWRGVIEVAKREQVQFSIIAGDMFESSNTTVEEFTRLYQVLRDFGKICPVICSAGNHDELSIGDFQTKYLALLNIPRVYVTQGEPVSLGLGYDGPHDSFSPVDAALKPYRVLAMPWTGIKDQAEFDTKIREHYLNEPFVILHECFKNISTDTGYKAKFGVQPPDIPGINYYALGDIHKHQNVSLPHAWYSGSPGQYNFGDKPRKGCIIIDVEHDTYTPRFVEIPSAIELHQISSLDEIPPLSPHWFQLIVPANKVPSAVPPNVKEIKPIPAKIDIPVEFSKEPEKAHLVTTNYVEGVLEYLTSAGYATEEIIPVIDELKQIMKAG
jgi:DNA repair exonuclease SbcCD nuclease subunit